MQSDNQLREQRDLMSLRRAELRARLLKVFSFNVKRWRVRRDLKQVELGASVGVNQSLVAGWEAGSTLPQYPTIIMLSDALNVSVAVLFDPAEYVAIKVPREAGIEDAIKEMEAVFNDSRRLA